MASLAAPSRWLPPGRTLSRGVQGLVIFAVALAARMAWTWHGQGLLARGNYDDGVYFRAALALVHGRLPYSDFLFLHPPGILVALAPFALLSRLTSDPVGFAASRVAWMLLGALNALLMARLLHRKSRTAALAGGLGYALFWPAVYSEHIALLEALSSTALIAALLLVWHPGSPRLRPAYALIAGACLGAGAAVKIWGVVPALIIAAWLWHRYSWREAWQLTAGTALGAGAVCAPFFCVAPVRMWQMVVSYQVGRPAGGRPLPYRLNNILGLNLYGQQQRLSLVLLGLLILLGIVAAVSWLDREHRLFAYLLVGMVGVLLATPSWFPHYSAFTAVPIVAVTATTVHQIGRWVQATSAAAGGWVSGAVLVTVAACAVPIATTGLGQDFPSRTFAAALAHAPGCVTSDEPSALILMNVASRNLDRRCPLLIDLAGLHLQYQVESGGSASGERAFQEAALAYFASGDATVIARYSANLGYTKLTSPVIRTWPTLAESGGYVLRLPPGRSE